MKFLFAHDNPWPTPALRHLKLFGTHYVCGISGCTEYLDLRSDIRDWFHEMDIYYKIEGVNAWGEGIANRPFELNIPNDAHALIFKLRWL